MKRNRNTPADYRELLAMVCRGLTDNDLNALAPKLKSGSQLHGVQVFSEGNFGKRKDKIFAEVPLVAEGFEPEEFDELLRRFVMSTPPLVSHETWVHVFQFLGWLEQVLVLTPGQRDRVRWQRARHRLDALAARRRGEYLRFQELFSVAESLLPELEHNEGLTVIANPIRARARFESPDLLGPDVALPAVMRVFVVGNDIRTALLDPVHEPFWREFLRHAPCTLSAWAAMSKVGGREELTAFCDAVVSQGLAALS